MARLTCLVLRDFRNYATLDLAVEPGLNLLVGPNGQGKTNVLEAIYFLSLLRSFRTSQLRNLFRWRTNSFIVRGEMESEGVSRSLAVEYALDHRQLRVANQPVQRASSFINRLCCVAFVPEDIDLVKGAAGERRRFLDISLAQLDAAYLGALQDYNKALKSRNVLLRRPRPPVAQLAAFEGVMAHHGAVVVDRRRQFVETLDVEVGTLAEQFYPSGQTLALQYQPSVGADLAAALEAERPRACERQHSTIGPHRDDLSIALDDKDLGRFGSEGQCRLAALVLKLATAIHVNRERRQGGADRGVVLLVDDVMGELDDRASRAFCAALATMEQVFLAATDSGPIAWLEPAAIFDVRAGEVTRRDPLIKESADADPPS